MAKSQQPKHPHNRDRLEWDQKARVITVIEDRLNHRRRPDQTKHKRPDPSNPASKTDRFLAVEFPDKNHTDGTDNKNKIYTDQDNPLYINKNLN
jgi:hypothetical protein